MKFIISFFICQAVWANGIEIYHVKNELKIAKTVKSIFVQNHDIPSSLISLFEVKKCPRIKDGKFKLVLCLNEERELRILNRSSQIIRSLKTFKSDVL